MTRAIVHPHQRTPGLGTAPRSHRNEAREKDEDRPLYDGLLARAFAKGIVDRFHDAGWSVAIAGSLRRGHDRVHDIDILASMPRYGKVVDGVFEPDGGAIKEYDNPVSLQGLDIVSSTPQKISFRAPIGIVAEVRVVPAESWGSALQYYTGSRAHNIWLRSLARHLQLSLSEYGFHELTWVEGELVKGPLIPIARESEVYKTLGLRWLPPRYRDKPNGHKGRYTPP